MTTPKRQRNAPMFHTTIASPMAFLQMCESMNAVLSRADFTLTCTDAFTGLRVASTDPSCVCAVTCKYAANVKGPDSTADFSIRLEETIRFLRRMPSSGTLVLRTNDETTQLCSVTDDSNAVGQTAEFSIPHIDTNNKLTYDTVESVESDFIVQVLFNSGKHVAGFKDIIQTAKSIKASVVQFTLESEGGEQCLRMQYTGEAGHRGNEVMRTGLDGDHADGVLYSGEFSTDFLARFCKGGLDRNTIQLGFKRDNPLVVQFGFGQEDTYVRFILAPYVDG